MAYIETVRDIVNNITTDSRFVDDHYKVNVKIIDYVGCDNEIKFTFYDGPIEKIPERLMSFQVIGFHRMTFNSAKYIDIRLEVVANNV